MAAEPILAVRGVHKYFTRGSEKIDVLQDRTAVVADRGIRESHQYVNGIAHIPAAATKVSMMESKKLR